jgi:hypothetical protein
MKYFFIITALILTSCGQKASKTNYEFSYGYFAKQDKAGKYPFIMNVYNIADNSLEIVSYNENRKVKNVLGSTNLTWATTSKGVKVGYNESEDWAVVFYNSQFYFSNGASASAIISDLKARNDFDNSLFLQDIIPSSDGSAHAESNIGLVKLSEEEISQFESSQAVSHNEVVREIAEGMDK